MNRRIPALLLLLPLGCGQHAELKSSGTTHRTSDSAYTAMQERGASPGAMGVDQYTSSHRFGDLADGGRIELQRTVADPEGVAQIRAHLQHIAEAFAEGDFRIPGFVHDRAAVAGTDVMSAKRARIRYEYEELPRGGAVRMYSTDAEAVAAIHRFLAFQRRDHRAAGHVAH